MKLREWIANRLPLFSKNERDQAWAEGVEFGKRQVGLSRDSRGRFASLHPRRNLGVLHAQDEDLTGLRTVESPNWDRRDKIT